MAKISSSFPSFCVVLGFSAWTLGGVLPAPAQGTTNDDASIPDPTLLESPGTAAAAGRARTVQAAPAPAAPQPTIEFAPRALPLVAGTEDTPVAAAPGSLSAPAPVLPILLVFGALAGLVLYQCGLTRAKNCSHTSLLVLMAACLGLAGYWMGGFAVQTGGVGDAHAAGPAALPLAVQGALDHELGFRFGGHYWGLMGSAGFFLGTDTPEREGIALLFLAQGALLAMALGIAMAGALERGKLLAMGVVAFLAGGLIFPLIANWSWGGGWLAETGREFRLGHGVIDLAGAGVIHAAAGALALAITVSLGPRHGRFTADTATSIPGHHVPFTLTGTVLLLGAIAAANLTGGGIAGQAGVPESAEALVNVVLGATGGAVLTLFLGAGSPRHELPARFCRGLLGGAVAISAGGALFSSWAAFLIGLAAGLVVEGAAWALGRRYIDDPAGAVAVHGAGGVWGLIAVGLFADGTAGKGMNGIDTPVRGLIFGGGGGQLGAQALAAVVDVGVVFALGLLALAVVRRILGLRVKLSEEIAGLDLSQTGALGYQPDVGGDEL